MYKGFTFAMSVLEHPVEFLDGKYITGYTGPEMLCLVNVSCQISYQVNLIHADSKLMRAEEVSGEVTRSFSCGADSCYLGSGAQVVFWE